MTTPVKGRSLTTRPRVEMGATPPQPTTTTAAPRVIHPPAPTIRLRTRFNRWQSSFHARHAFTWWLILIAICLISIRIWWGAMSTWPAFKAYFICFAIFWGTCIGMLPVMAIFRSGQNIIEDIFT